MRRARHWAQRARRGYSDEDCWSQDGYVSGMLSQALITLHDNTHSYPGTDEFPTFEVWQAYLTDLSARLGAWNDDTYLEDEAYEVTRAAMVEFGAHLGCFWD